jgi:hypothetical protein
MDLIFSYELFGEGGEQSRGSAVRTVTGSEQSQPHFPGSDVRCDCESVETIYLSDGRVIKVFWAQGLFDHEGDLHSLLRAPRDLALIDAFGKYVFLCKAEPTVDERIGIAIVNERGKTILVGTGDVLTERDPNGEEFPYLVAFGQEVYKWRRASPSSCAHTSYAVKNPGTFPK